MPFCTGCGTNVPEEVRFCTSCGKAIVATAEPSASTAAPSPPAQQQSYAQPDVPVEPAPPPVQQQSYAQPQAPIPPAPPPVHARQPAAYGQPAPAPPEGQYAVVSTLGWLGTLILLSIPIVGLIVCIVWAFGSGNLNRRNLSRACLILAVVGFVLLIVFSVAIAAMFPIGPFFEQINVVRSGVSG